MVIYEKPINWYVDKLKNNEYFSLPGYGDAEWMCMLKEISRMGTRSGFGMLLAEETGDLLVETLKIDEPNYLRASPIAIKQIFGHGRINRFLTEQNIHDGFYERDMITDELAMSAGLYPLIEQLRQMDVVVVGNPALEALDIFPVQKFFATGTPDFHLDYRGMDEVVQRILDYGKPAVYSFSAGMSAALMIARLHGKIPRSFFLDLGSIWDAFVGIGGQREWRAKLYEDKVALEKWKTQNLNKTA